MYVHRPFCGGVAPPSIVILNYHKNHMILTPNLQTTLFKQSTLIFHYLFKSMGGTMKILMGTLLCSIYMSYIHVLVLF